MDQYFLKTKPVGQLLITLGLPMMISMLINSLYNIIDSIYVSRLGTSAVAALAVIFPLQNLTIAISVGLGVGVNSVIARFMGADKTDSANKAATIGVLLACFHFILFFLIGLYGIKYYVSFFSVPGSQTYQWSVEYGQIVLIWSLPYLLYLVFEKLFQSLGWMKTAMTVMILAAVTNILLDPIMIFGYFGFPALGVSGAAIATVIGQCVGFLAFVIVYWVSRFPVRIKMKYFRLNWELIRDTYNIAVPAAVTLALPSLLVALLNGILVQYSEISVAVLGLYYRIQTFFYMPCSGLIQGMRPLISFNFGAGEYKRVLRTSVLAVLIAALILTIGFLIMEFFPGTVMDLFSPEPALREQGITALRIIALGFTASSIPIISNGIFEAIGLGMKSLIVSLLRQLIIMVPLAYVLSALYAVQGVWWAFPVSEILTAVISLIMVIQSFIQKGILEEKN